MITFTIRAAGCTRQGLRASNEDRYALDADRQVFVVADGMGGGSGGERAAALAVDLLPRRIRARLDDRGQPETAIQRALAEANQAILALSGQLEAGRRCGAAVVLAFRSGDQVFIPWLGDCRAYQVTATGVQRLTQDHNIRNALIRAGTLTEEEAARSLIHNVLHRFLGCNELTEPFEFCTIRPEPGDRLILATDGLYPLFEENDLAAVCRAHPDPQECADQLVEEALRRGSRDNVTCVVADFDPVRIDAAWLAWNDGTVAHLARTIHEENVFDGMPVLADALEDAGCTETALLEHCRAGGPHARGCWVVNLLLDNRM
jgi:protein phosphatase